MTFLKHLSQHRQIASDHETLRQNKRFRASASAISPAHRASCEPEPSHREAESVDWQIWCLLTWKALQQIIFD